MHHIAEAQRLQVEHLPIDTLTPHPRNYRAHPEEQLQHLEESLRQGWYRNVVIARDNTILAGHGIIQAARRLGLTEAPCVRLDLDPEDPRALKVLTADNELPRLAVDDLAGLAHLLSDVRDADLIGLLGTGYDSAALDELLHASLPVPAPKTDPDAIPEAPEQAVTQQGDLWRLGSHRLLCGDSTHEPAVQRLMNGERAVMMATDPPYLVNYSGGNHPQSWSKKPDVRDKVWDTYHEGAEQLYVDFVRVALQVALVTGPIIYQWHATRTQRFVEDAWRENGLLWHQTVNWVKSRPVLTRSHFMWQSEPAAYGWPKGEQQKDRRPPANTPNVWMIDSRADPDNSSDDRVEHLTQKPVEIVTRPIGYHTRPGEVLYEPFAGSGTAIIAAEMTGRRCYAMELEPLYCDVAVQRWEQFTGQAAHREPAVEAG